MKKFIYQVAGYEFSDTVAFGKAWQDAKAMATETGSPIGRLVVKDGDIIRREFYAKGGCFLSMEFYSEDRLAKF